MVQSSNFGYLYIYLWEWLALPFYVIIIYFISRAHQRRKIKDNPVYEYYQKGLMLKILGGIAFALIYYYYYQGGDTFMYFESSMTMKNLMLNSFSSFVKNEFGGASMENFALFNSNTGYPMVYMYNDPQTFSVIRLVTPIVLLSFSGYLISTVLLAWLSYAGLWKLFLVFTEYYPHLKKQLFIAILCFPSVIFWGSGILKDTITLSSSGWVVYCIYKIFIVRKSILRYLLLFIPFSLIILSIKPYIIFALLPGSLMWIFSNRVYRIRNTLIRIMVIPMIFIVCLTGGYFIMKNLGKYMGKFSIDRVSTTAKVIETDLKKDYYGGHSFDIGTFENTPSGYLKIFPKAFVAGAYRPFIWESGNIVMLISGIENAFLLYLTFLTLRRVGFRIFKRLFKEPLLFFAFSYSVFFAFAVGLTTSNFGALVRFKIAYLPFFTACLYILSWKEKYSEETETSLNEINTSYSTNPQISTAGY
jgi:hypothetical protein